MWGACGGNAACYCLSVHALSREVCVVGTLVTHSPLLPTLPRNTFDHHYRHLHHPKQTELAFKKLGVEPVVMSAGELESEVAGQPGRLIRERYRWVVSNIKHCACGCWLVARCVAWFVGTGGFVAEMWMVCQLCMSSCTQQAPERPGIALLSHWLIDNVRAPSHPVPHSHSSFALTPAPLHTLPHSI